MEYFFQLAALNSTIFSNLLNWIVRVYQDEDYWNMDISDSVKFKIDSRTSHMHGMAGYGFFKQAGYSRDRRGIFLIGAGLKRDIGGVSQVLET